MKLQPALALMSLCGLCATSSLEALRIIIESKGILHGIAMERSTWPVFSNFATQLTPVFEASCHIFPDSSSILRYHMGQLTCATAAAIADLVEHVCLADLACHHPFLAKHEKQIVLESDTPHRASHACIIASLLIGLDGVVIGSLDPDYERLTRVNWSTNCWLKPRCIIRPRNTLHVQSIMKIISHTSTSFIIRSGGHNPNPRWGSIGNSGIMIDLSLLDNINISEDNLTVTVGPGNRWIDVYRKLEGSGRTVLGGRMPDVGVGGLLLGGGMPSFSSQFGFSCDYVRRFEVVLSNGTVVTADRKTNADLWWALKGGGPNFGVVTRFELETVPVGEIWYESRIYDPDQSIRLLEAVREYQIAAENDEQASFAFSLSNNHTFVAFIYSIPVEYPPVFAMFYDIPFQRKFIVSTFGTPYTLAGAFEKVLGDRPSFKRDIIAVSTKPDLYLYKEGYKQWLLLSLEMLSKFDCMMTFGIQPVTASAITKSNLRGGNPLNLKPESQQWYTSVIQWQDERFSDLAHEAIVRSGDAMRTIALNNGLLLEFQFMNDASWHQNPIKSYGKANVKRMLDISNRYDPSQIFQNLQGGGFLLRDSVADG